MILIRSRRKNSPRSYQVPLEAVLEALDYVDQESAAHRLIEQERDERRPGSAHRGLLDPAPE